MACYKCGSTSVILLHVLPLLILLLLLVIILLLIMIISDLVTLVHIESKRRPIKATAL